MSPRKKNPNKQGPLNQSTINNFFPAKSKHASTSTRPQRLARSSLAARPLRSKRSPDPEEILDLTHSTSPLRESESPPSAKKRKLRATSPYHSPIRGAQKGPLPLPPSRSPSPASYTSQQTMESRSSAVPVSPAPSQTGRSQAMLDIDPDEIIESSQTQYLNLRFTPSSQCVAHVDPGHVPAPVFKPAPTRSRQQSHEPSITHKTSGPPDATEESQSTVFIPSSQGEISEPFEPRKRNWTLMDQSGAGNQTPLGSMLPDAQGSNTVNYSTGTPKRQWPTNATPPQVHPAFANTPTKNRAVTANPFTPCFSSPRPIYSPMYPSGRSDQIPSSQGEPSLEATELGTVESPPKPTKFPAVAAFLPPFAPAPVPAMQYTLHTHQRATTPPLPISNINPDTQTPPRVVQQNPPSSPIDFPSPGRLMSSLGFEAPHNIANTPLPVQGSTILSKVDEVETLTPTNVPPDLPYPSEDVHSRLAVEADRSQVYGEESPTRSQSSSQTIVPSSQPIHDSSPPPEYDLDPKRHSFNQGRLQSFTQPPVLAQPSALFDSRFPSNSSRPYFTAPTHRYSPHSSQSLPPSQSPIKGGQFDPNQSAAGMRAVFGMLGFGSEAEAQIEAHQRDLDEGIDPHIPVTYDLPPSSPPPQTPTRHDSRESSPDSYLVPVSGQKGKGKPRIGKTPIRDSPLIRAFEAAKKRSKTVTSSGVRRPTSKISQVVSSPVRPAHLDDMDIDSSPVRGSQNSSTRPKPNAGKVRAELGVVQTPASSGRPRRTFQATPSKGSQNTRQTGLAARSQRQMSVDSEIVESSDAEEMEMDMPPSPTLPTSTRATAGAKSSMEPTKPSTPERNRPSIRIWEELDRERTSMTPPCEERLPSSVSPSPIRIHHSPPARNTRSSSPPSENTQTQEESETPWESLRPSQSVSQVYERQLVEEAERERRLQLEQNAEKQKGKTLVEESPDMTEGEQADMDRGESLQREESLDQEPVHPVTISLNPRSPTNVPDEPPRLVLPHSFSTPTTQRAAGKAHYIVTPTKASKRTPARATSSRKSMTPSSTVGEDDEEYTYVEETFNPTESQMSFLNRILQGNSSEIS